jgi:murein L,D-transpeptidase YcbB/YkuD
VVLFTACDSPPSKDQKVVKSVRQLNDAVAVQLNELLQPKADSLNQPFYNTPHISKFYAAREYKPLWSAKGKFNAAATSLKKFIDSEAKYYGLYVAHYHEQDLTKLMTALAKDSLSLNAEQWAKCEALLTDAAMQICKHVANGRLYVDTNYKYFDSSLHTTVFVPALTKLEAGTAPAQVVSAFEPNFAEYRNLKDALRNVIDGKVKTYTHVNFPAKDSLSLIRSVISRLQQEGFAAGLKDVPDSFAVADAIKQWQKQHGEEAQGLLNKDLIASLNMQGNGNFDQAALSMDKLRGTKIKHDGNYVLVNIPSYYLQAYKNNEVAVESKVAVGKVASKTPTMESEISDVVVMPMWFVPPSILKIPGWLDRHRNNPNFVVRGKTAMQKSGPGNALGNMKFNFKSGDAIYLHDTNEKWAFGSSKRAVSHGCVRVQQYAKLAEFIASVSPVYEKRYEKVMASYTVDSLGDSVKKFKYVVKDSVTFTGDSIFVGMLKRKAHREITVGKKVPIYIKYFTCVGRNGSLVTYPDVYGYDQAMIAKYLKKGIS